MPVEILMPSTGASMSEGSILRWLKQEGEAVERGEALFEIETDKAVAEAVAPARGILGRILAAGGSEGIKVDSVVGLIAVDGEDLAASASAAAEPAGATPVGSAPAGAATVATAAGEASPAGEQQRIPASPLARRLARETGVDLAAVRGPVLAPGLGAQGATPADLRATFGAAYPQVLGTSSRDILSAGPEQRGLRDAAQRTLDGLRGE